MTINDALALHHAGRLAEAERAYRQILAAQPGQYHALHFLGVLLAQKGDMTGSAELLAKSLSLFEANAIAHFHLAETVLKLGRFDQATGHYRRALELDPAIVPAYARLGGCLIESGKAEEGLKVCDEGLARAPDEAGLYACRGDGLVLLKRLDEALAAFDAAIARDPGLTGALVGRARILFERGDRDGAFACLAQAMAAHPEAVEPYISKAILLTELGHRQEALDTYQQALALDPAAEDTYYNMGCLLLAMRFYQPAVAAFDSALAIRANFYSAEYNRAWALERLGQRDEALAGCERALKLNPDAGMVASKAFFLRASVCDWQIRPMEVERLKRLAGSGAKLDPFYLLSALDAPDLHRTAATTQAPDPKPALPKRGVNDKLRIAYLSPDFHDHPVGHHLVAMLEAHDRDRFEILAIDLEDGPDSAIRTRLQKAVDRFVPVHGWTDAAIAGYLHEAGVDIGIDLAGYTLGGRTAAFASRPVPVSVVWLGYPGTTGTPFVDYIIADPVLIPPEDERFYTEKVARLPFTYLPRDAELKPGPCPSRAELGLPQDAFVFCGFNNMYKITPEIFDVWMRLVQAVEGSVLWLNTANPLARANLVREAAARGVAGERLIFADRIEERAGHLSRLAAADLFLDTVPYGAHSTASDMLWAGVPVLTVTGKSFASRVAAGLLTALDLHELIAPDLDTYEAMARSLASDPVRLRALRKKIEDTAPSAPAFDPVTFCRSMEAAFRTMAERVRSGAPPASFSVTLPLV